jgi:hypothetical protein
MKDKRDSDTPDMFGGGRMSFDDDYHVSGGFHAEIAAKTVRNTTELFQQRMKTLAQAIALCCKDFDGSYLMLAYETIYVPLAEDGSLAWEDRENLFPRPREVAYRRMSNEINVWLTLSGQRNYFTSASTVYLEPLGATFGKVVPLRKRTHDLVLGFGSTLYTPTSELQVSVRLRRALRVMVGDWEVGQQRRRR